MRKVWIIVANASQTIIYKAENVHKLTEIKKLQHAESHLARRDLVSDKQGRGHQRIGSANDTLSDTTSPKEKEANIFAHEIAHFLEEGYKNGEYERLYLISKPPFLGYLRQSLSPHVSKLIESEIHKDLTLIKSEEIREYLPPVL